MVCWVVIYVRLQKRDTHSEETVLSSFQNPGCKRWRATLSAPAPLSAQARCWPTRSSRKWTEGLGRAPHGCPSQVDLAPHHGHPKEGHFTVWYAGLLEHRFKGLVDLSEGGPVGGIPLPTWGWDPSQTAHEALLTRGDETFSVESLEIKHSNPV